MQENENLQDKYQELVEKFQGDHTGVLEWALKKYKEKSVLVFGTEEILKQQKELLKTRENDLNDTKLFINWIMQRQETTKFESKYGKVSYRKSQSVNVIDESKILDEYKRIEEVLKIDKMKIKEDLKAGKTFDRAELKESNNIQIK